MIIDLSDDNVVGCSTPDPLSHAFVKKTSAHASGRAMPIAVKDTQLALEASLCTKPLVPLSRCLYVHIPFCRVRCTFCNFFQYASSKSLLESYFDALLKEIQLKSQLPWAQSAPFQAVYIGGGTPTDMSAEQLKTLGKVLRNSFPLTPDCEITLEGRVNRFNAEKFENALEGGFNRFSFGIQSFNTKVRKAAKRLDDRDDVLRRIQEMVRYNAAPIVLDLLYGLPHQTIDIWCDDLDDYLESGADGVDLYQLIEMNGTPMERLVEKGVLPAPSDTVTKARMFKVGVEFMAKHHQRRLSINHWASNNRERSIYNSLAKTTAEVLPLGAGAGGNVGGISMMHHRDMDKYITAINDNKFPIAMALRMPENAARMAELKSAFDRGVLSAQRLNRVFASDLYSQLMPLFEKWQENGLVILEEKYLSLTIAGQFWSVTLVQNLIKIIENNKIDCTQRSLEKTI